MNSIKIIHLALLIFCLHVEMNSAKVRIILSAALTDNYFDFRKQQYIQSFTALQNFGYRDFYVVEALKKQGPTFINDFTPYVFYATANNPNLRNNGINEAKTLLEASYYFNFDPEDMIIKITGRYLLLTDGFIKFVETNPKYDVVAKFNESLDLFTLGFAMKCKYFREMFESFDYASMERDMLGIEVMVGRYVRYKLSQGSIKVCAVGQLGIEANIYGSSNAQGTAEVILIY